MSQIYGQIKGIDGTTKWKPIEAVLQADGSYAMRVDTELVLDAGNITISNLKVGSTNQTVSGARWLKTLDDGTVVVSDGVDNPLAGFNAARAQDIGAFPHYFGLVDIDENWIIIEQSRSGTEDTFLYASGAGSFLTNWGNRDTTLVYDEYFTEF